MLPGVHDLGGRAEHFAAVQHDPDVPVFHERWEARVCGTVEFVHIVLGKSVDEFRYEIEQLPAPQYFRSYYARKLAALETELERDGYLVDGELDAKISGQPAGESRRGSRAGARHPPPRITRRPHRRNPGRRGPHRPQRRVVDVQVQGAGADGGVRAAQLDAGVSGVRAHQLEPAALGQATDPAGAVMPQKHGGDKPRPMKCPFCGRPALVVRILASPTLPRWVGAHVLPRVFGGARRTRRPPMFAVGDAVIVRPRRDGHTRQPGYVTGKTGVVTEHQGAALLPDARAVRRHEPPQHLYTVAFDGRELWGSNAEEGTEVRIDLYEPYLERA